MRVTVDENDEGYSAERNEWVLDIEFNGKLIPRNQAITADEEAGKVLVYVFSDRLRPVMIQRDDKPEKPFMRVLSGNVKIHWRMSKLDRRPQPFVGPGITWPKDWEKRL